MNAKTDMKSDDVLRRNLAFIKARSSEASYAELEAASAREPGINVELARDGILFSALASGSARVLLHSRREPLIEARRQLELWISREKPLLDGVVVLVGAAGLYHLEALLPLVPEGSTLLLAESSPESLLPVLRFREITHFERLGVGLRFLISNDLSRLAQEYRLQLASLRRLSVAAFVPPSLRRAFPERSARLLEMLKKESSVEGFDRNTKAFLCDEWLQHAIFNLPHSLSSPGVEALKGLGEGRSAIVVGAGPSLNESLPFIKSIAGSCLIFSVGTALKPLLASGLEPDFVVAIDSDPKTMPQYQGIEKGKVFLLASQSVFPELAEKYKGQTFFFANTALESFNAWLASFAALPASAAAGGTVALTAIDLARQLGSKRVFFAGLDLAFRKDGITHANKSMYEGAKQRPEELVEVPGNGGNAVLTSRQFALYIEILNSYLDYVVRECGLEFYNVNTGGAAFRNAKLIPPEKLPAFEEPLPVFEKTDLVRERHEAARRPDKASALAAMQEAHCAVLRLGRDAKAAAELCENIAGGAKNTGVEEEILRLDAEIKSNGTGKLLVLGGLEAVLMDLYKGRKENPDGSESGKTEERLRFYRHLQGTAEWVAGMLEMARNGYQNNFKFITGR